MTIKGSIGDLLRSGTMAIITSPEFEGMERHVLAFMGNFTETGGCLAELTLYLQKIDTPWRFDFMAMMIFKAFPPDFPKDNSKLTHAIFNLVHSALAATTTYAVPDGVMAEKLDMVKEGENPYVLVAN